VAGKDALLIALGRPAPAEKDEGESSDEESFEQESAGAILDAIRTKDKDALADALKSFVAKCMADYDKEEGDKGEGE